MAVRYVFFSKIEFSNAGGVQSQPECYILPNFVVIGPEPLWKNGDFLILKTRKAVAGNKPTTDVRCHAGVIA